MKKHTSKLLAQKLTEDGKLLWVTAMQRAAGNTSSIRVWDEAFHPEQVYSEIFFKQKMDYIHKNPVEAGYVLHPQDWLHSSAGYYYQEREPTIPLTSVMW